MSEGFLFRMERCTGCNACELACSTENELGWGRSWRQVFHLNEPREPGAPTLHLSLACNHCDDAPCMRACPTLALRRSPETGAVLVDEDRCMGCRYCSWACPYEALHFDHERRVMSKCTLCHHRLREGGTPACVEACPTGALDFGALVGRTGAPGLPGTDAGPRVRFPETGRELTPLETTWSLPEEVLTSFEEARPERSGRISFRAELPLWAFTSAVAGLAGWALAAALGGPALEPAAFLAVAVLAGALSFLHLGRKSRAWRALANLRRSALSREVAAFGAFVGAGGVAAVARAAAGPSGVGSGGGVAARLADLVPGWLVGLAEPLTVGAAVTGLLALWAVDRVYDPVRPEGAGPVHSADTVLAGPGLAAVLVGAPAAFLTLAVVQAALYVRRGAHGEGRPATSGLGAAAAPSRRGAAPSGAGGRAGPGWDPSGPGWAALRLGVGLLAPAALLWTRPDAWPWAAALFAAGALVDRAAFYDELEPTRPGRV